MVTVISTPFEMVDTVRQSLSIKCCVWGIIPHVFTSIEGKLWPTLINLLLSKNPVVPFKICGDSCIKLSYIFDWTLLVPLVIYMYSFC